MKKSVDCFKKLPYTIEIIPDEDVFFIKIKELPGCISQGSTKQEALEMVDEAMTLWLEAALEDVDEIPLPESMQEAKYSGKLSLRMPKSLHKKIANEAKEEGVSINSYVISCLSETYAFNKVEKIIEEKFTSKNDFQLSTNLNDYTQDWYSNEVDDKLGIFQHSGKSQFVKRTTDLQSMN